jgi:peptidoglycan hydrolase-like protein with peptidoglycan-binding domain
MSSSTSSLQAELNTLLAELAALETQANGSPSSVASSSSYVFTRNLSFGLTGNDVKELQMFLISENTGPAARKLAAHGTTETFAALTLNALIEFQKNVGIHPAIGYFGPTTRAYVNNLGEKSSAV